MSDKQKKNIWFVLIIAIFGIVLFPLVYRIINLKFSVVDQNVEVLFRESITRVIPNQGDVLEVATVESFDTFTRRDTKSLFDNLVYLGTTVSEIKVKVTYRYHVLLSGDWKTQLKGRDLEVIAPSLRPSLPPAIHTDEMEKRSEAGWLRFNAQDNLDKLEASLTPTLAATSLSPAKMILAKEAAKASIENFVKKWILPQEQWRNIPIEQIRVSFDK